MRTNCHKGYWSSVVNPDRNASLLGFNTSAKIRENERKQVEVDYSLSVGLHPLPYS